VTAKDLVQVSLAVIESAATGPHILMKRDLQMIDHPVYGEKL
jgi:hypothetical protein